MTTHTHTHTHTNTHTHTHTYTHTHRKGGVFTVALRKSKSALHGAVSRTPEMIHDTTLNTAHSTTLLPHSAIHHHSTKHTKTYCEPLHTAQLFY